MAYTANDASNTLFDYLGVKSSEIEYIDNTNKRGIIYSSNSNDKCVIFIYPISHKQDNSKNFFDTRDSGARERGIAWKYALENDMKYFCLAVHDQVEKYKDYIFSLECHEEKIELVSGTSGGSRVGPGTQVVIPNDYIPSEPFSRIKTKHGFFISVIHKKNVVEYIDIYDNRPYCSTVATTDMVINTEKIENIENNFKSDFHRNRIIFGAPGTGKSFLINNERKALLSNGGEYERVTFHPDYSYAQFVGTYKPTMLENAKITQQSEEEKNILSILCDKRKSAQEKYDLLYPLFFDLEKLTTIPVLLGLYTDEPFKTLKKDGSDNSGDNGLGKSHGKYIRSYVNLMKENEPSNVISYEYVPGPFMRTLVKSYKSPQQPFLLIIEEINRANVAAVFGDVFQLLDRDDDENSEYPIQTTEDMRKYLAKELGGSPSDYSEMKIPYNMFIWATMNSADQGVFPMDTAFKRRWDFTYLGVNTNESGLLGKKVTLGTGQYERSVEWNTLRKAINSALLSYKINEDKLLGPYFISKKVLGDGEEISTDEFIRVFKNKVLMYLFEDAAKQKRPSFFTGCDEKNLYSSICEEFDTKGVSIFCDEIKNAFPQSQQGDGE